MKIVCSVRALLSWLAIAFLFGLGLGVQVVGTLPPEATDVRASVTAPN